MRKGTSSGHYFETDAAQAQKERRAAKAGNKNGNPVALKAKLVAVIPDPSSPSSVFVAESTGCIRRVNVDSADAAQQVYRGPTAPVTSVAVGGPGSGTVFAGCWDKDVWSWDAASGKVGRRYSGHTDFVKAVACAVVGGRHVLLSGGADKKIMVWDVESGARLHAMQDPTVAMMAVQHLAVDPLGGTSGVPGSDGESGGSGGGGSIVVASAGSDPHIRRWRVRLDGYEQLPEAAGPGGNGEARHTVLQHDTTVYKLVFDGAGDEVDLWTASGDGTAKCLSRAKEFAVAEDTIEHGDHVRAVAVTDQWAITAGRDEDVKVWDRVTGKLYCALEGHYDEVTDLTLLGGGSVGDSPRVVSVSIDGTVRTWPLAQGDLDKANKEREERHKGVEKQPEPAAEGLMTADEEAELAALMEDD